MLEAKGPYSNFKRYEIPINGKPYGFYTANSADGIIAWLPDNEQQHLNPQYRNGIGNVGITPETMIRDDITTMLAQVLLFQTKLQFPKADVERNHAPLVDAVEKGFRKARHIKRPILPMPVEYQTTF